MTDSAKPAPATGRIAGLDAWRGSLLTLGVFLHGSNFFQGPLFALLNYLGSFAHSRMPAFFMISGMLSAMTLMKAAERRSWLTRRLVLIGVPFLFGSLVLNPLMFWQVDRLGEVSPIFAIFSARSGFLAFAHLWFLLVLLIVTVLLFALWPAIARFDRGFAHRHASGWLVYPAMLLVTLGFRAADIVLARAVTLPENAAWIVSAVLQACPFFFIGALIGRDRKVLDAATGALWKLSLVVVFAYVANVVLRTLGQPLFNPGYYGNQALLGLTTIALSLLVIYSAVRIAHVPAFLRSLSQSSYFIYLLHVLSLVTLVWLMRGLGLADMVIYVAAVSITVVGLLLIDQAVVKRVPLLRLLFNGRWK